MQASEGGRIRRLDERGVTLTELIVGLSVFAIGLAVSFGFYSQYRESIAATRAAQVINQDVQLARSLAIRERAPISIVVDESARTYRIRDTLGNDYHRRDFGASAEIRLSSIDFQTAGDSLTFDARGIAISGGTRQIDIARGAKTRQITLNALGRTAVN